MKLRIASIHGHGDADEEFVLINVVEDCDLDHFLIADTTYTGDHKISNKVRHVLWFSTQKVKKGDSVELRTRRGKNIATAQDDGSTRYIVHWQLNEPVWNDDGDGAVLFAIQTWKATPAVGE